MLDVPDSPPRELSIEDRTLGWLLGLGDLAPREIHHGYANGCICSDCLERHERMLEVRPPVRQPWEAKAA